MQKVASLARAFLLFPILSLAAPGQSPISNWDSVKMLAPGTKIRVAQGNSKPIAGKLASVTDSNLIVTRSTGTESFPRLGMRSVFIKDRGHRVRNTFIGLGLGYGIGISVAGTIGGSKLVPLRPPWGAAVIEGAGIVAGGAAGRLWPTGWRRVYAPPSGARDVR